MLIVVAVLEMQHKSDIKQDPFILIFQFMIEIEAKKKKHKPTKFHRVKTFLNDST